MNNNYNISEYHEKWKEMNVIRSINPTFIKSIRNIPQWSNKEVSLYY